MTDAAPRSIGDTAARGTGITLAGQGARAVLRAGPLLPRQVVARYTSTEAATVTTALRTLVESGKLHYSADGRLNVMDNGGNVVLR